MTEDLQVVFELIRRNISLSAILGFISLSGLIALYEKFRTKSSNVYIRQRYETGAAIRQPNRIDIDLFLYAENTGDLTGTLEFCTLTGDVIFTDGNESTRVDVSELNKKEARITSPAERSLSPDDGFPLILRFTFPKNGRLSEMLSCYSEMEIPWGVRVTEGKREYMVTGTAIVKHSSGGAQFPPVDSFK